MTRKERFKQVQELFQEHMPVAETELKYTNPYELLVAVILSAQCTDKRVNMLTPRFFKLFPSAEHLKHATQDEVFELIKSCSYPNNKAKNLLGMARVLMDDFAGKCLLILMSCKNCPGLGARQPT